MTVTRLFFDGFETGSLEALETESTFGTAGGSVSSVGSIRTGSYVWSPSTQGKGRTINTSHFRACFAFDHDGFAGSGNRQLYFVYTTGGAAIRVYIYRSSDNLTTELRIRVNGVDVATLDWSSSGLSTLNTYKLFGVNAKLDVTNGYISVYADGVKVLEFVGDTGGAANGVWVCGRVASTVLSQFRVDDLYCDDIAGEADIAPPAIYFHAKTVTGAGNYTQWTPSAGSNWQNVDDALTGNSDGDTTYNKTLATAQKDSYAVADFTVPAGYKVAAYSAMVVGRKTGTEDCKIKVGVRENSVDADGAEQVMTTSYRTYFQRFPNRPSGGPWDQATANAAEILVESAGTFA